MSQSVFSYVIYLLHEIAESWGTTPGEVYFTLKNSGCLDNYIIPNYDTLHTLGTSYIVNDITEYLRIRGIQPC